MNKIKNLHLISASVIIILVGLSYGFYPEQIIPLLLDIQVKTIDLSNVFRAIMGLYIAMAIYWIMGIRNAEYWKGATISMIVFMAGLAFGRIISILFDGIPTLNIILGLIAELFFVIWGVYSLKKHEKVI